MIEPFRCEIEQDTAGARVVPVGELDLMTVPLLEAALQEAEQHQPQRVLLDLGRLTFIDSSGLQVILRAEQRLAESGSQLVLRSGSPEVERIFDLSGVRPRLFFEDDARESGEA
jgi:stage II sporulation protein AA (anti-sigma F factor antagonist)